MNYTAQNIDPEKFEAELCEMRKYKYEDMTLTVEKARAYFVGYEDCINHVIDMLHCQNYEKEAQTEEDDNG